ncbi:MAG: hypothetical protein HQM14_18770 [SAR324 cluster bacterium]|nr:hypothetical protein [SAR324 cluster bacterium]
MISITHNLKEVAKRLKRIEKQIPFATRNAINATAFDAQREAKEAMPKFFDRPTPFTVKGVQVNKATKQNLKAEVVIPANREYLGRQIKGGVLEPKKGKDLIFPGPAQSLNKYGNIPKNRYKTLRSKSNVFVGQPKGQTNRGFGVYQRTGKGGSKGLKKWINFVPQAWYKPRFPFAQVVSKAINKYFDRNFTKAFQHATRTAKR